jgi:ribosomal protein S18 acetylase RimI-like enzyme
MDVLEGDGLVALIDGAAVGIVTWLVDSAAESAEIRALVVPAHRRRGAGRALLRAVEEALRGRAVGHAWIVTTNDNLTALALYQQAGYRLAALRAGAVDESRRTIKRSIPEMGEHGIPLRDELELERIIR